MEREHRAHSKPNTNILQPNACTLTIFRTHLLACPCGSMNSGHRRENCTMTPFSTDRLSLGKPAICQLRTFTGSLIVSTRFGWSVWGTLYLSNCLIHSAVISCRNSPYTSAETSMYLFIFASVSCESRCLDEFL